MPVAGGPKITKTGILLEVDAADRTSYPGSGTSWTNQITPGTNDGTLNNISFDSTDSKGALIFTGSNTYVDFGNIGNLSSAWSFQVAFKPAATASDPYTILSYASGSDTGSITFKLDYSSSTQEVILSTFSTASATAEIVHQISASAESGSWNIVHGTFGSQLGALYVNGLGQAYVPTTGSTTGYNASNRLYAGGSYGVSTGFYTGSMANVSVNNADLDGLTVNKNYNALCYRFGLPVRRPLVTDADAFNFVEVASLTDETQILAINSLVLGLKSNNLWNKMQVIYPFVGGTSISHKWNLKNPIDADSAFRIQYSGVVNHSSNGVTSGGGYIETYFKPSDITPPSSSFHFSTYLFTTSSNNNGWILGNNWLQGIMYVTQYAGGNFYLTNLFQGYNQFSDTYDERGYHIMSRTNTTSATVHRYLQEGDFTNANSNTFSNPNNNSIRILSVPTRATYNGIVNFVTFGSGLTAAETSTLNTIVRNFNTALSRNVV